MTAPIRLLVSDIDGTLVRNDKSLSEQVVAAAKRVQQAGLTMSLISARPPSGMFRIAERRGLTGPIGACHGGTLVRPDGGILCAERLAPDVAARAFALIDRPGVKPWLFADGKWLARDRDDPHIARERRSANLEPIFDTDFAGLLDRVDKLVGVSDDPDLLSAVEKAARAALGDGANVSRSQTYYLDITAPRANKGDGVAALAKAYGVPLTAVAVLGDQFNDVPMFARAALSVAMGQAPEAVRAAATHVARSNEDDGVADAIARFILPQVAA